MNRYVKFGLWSAVAAMIVLAGAAVIWRMLMPAADVAGLPHRPLAPFILLAIPAIMAVMLVISIRNLDARIPGISEDNTRHVEGAMVFLFLFVTACVGWMGFMYVGGRLPGGDLVVRGAVVLMGVGMAVRGNFVGKLSPPAVKDPPDPAVWGRLARRMGWTLAATGVTLAVCAMTLPLRLLTLVMLAAALVPIGLTILQRRMLARPS